MIYPQCTSLWILSVVDCWSRLCMQRQLPLCMKRQSPLHMKRQLPLCTWKGDCLCMWKGNCLCCILGRDWWLMQRGSPVNFHMENSNDFKLFFLHVGNKTVLICSSPQCMKSWLPLCLKRWLPVHMKRQCTSVDPGVYWSPQIWSTVNFHMQEVHKI